MIADHFNGSVSKMNKKSCILHKNLISFYKKKKKQNIAWPLGDMNLIFKCCKYLPLVRFAHL